jgi:hypothetical protein
MEPKGSSNTLVTIKKITQRRHIPEEILHSRMRTSSLEELRDLYREFSGMFHTFHKGEILWA